MPIASDDHERHPLCMRHPLGIPVSWKNRGPEASATGTGAMARRPEEQLQSTGRRLQEAQQLVAETEEIASRTRNNLGEQREALQRTQDNVEDAQEDAQDAKLHLISLRSKKQWQIFSLYFIIVVLAAHLVFRVIKSVT